MSTYDNIHTGMSHIDAIQIDDSDSSQEYLQLLTTNNKLTSNKSRNKNKNIKRSKPTLVNSQLITSFFGNNTLTSDKCVTTPQEDPSYNFLQIIQPTIHMNNADNDSNEKSKIDKSISDNDRSIDNESDADLTHQDGPSIYIFFFFEITLAY